VIHLLKKGDRTNCDYYGETSLIYTVHKINAEIIAREIARIIPILISIQKRYSYTSSIFIIRRLVKKHKDNNWGSLLLFVDLKGAFYSVLRNELWGIEINRETGKLRVV
jgi:hypothetical protein